MKIKNPFYLSRSMIEAFRKCLRYGYWHYLYNDTGITADSLSIPLSTGICTHLGIYRLLIALKTKELTLTSTPQLRVGIIKEAVDIAVVEYKRILAESDYTTFSADDKANLEFYKKEQIGITEGLIRAWGYVELPNLLKFYDVVSAEKSEVNTIFKYGGIPVKLQTRADGVIKKKGTKDYYTYSLKTAKEVTDKTLESYAREIQVNTEMFGVDQWLRKLKKSRGIDLASHVTGVRFCFLVKGNRIEEKDIEGKKTGKWITYSPFVRGYKNISPAGVDYAHSWFYPNPNNKSGKSTLGKGWLPFYVWDEGMSVHKWMMKIRKQEVFPETHDVIKEHVVIPPEIFRNEEKQKDTLRQTEIFVKNAILNPMQEGSSHEEYLDLFGPDYQRCMYPYQCEFLQLCDYKDRRLNPEGFGYMGRMPHHEAELVQVKGIYEERTRNKN